VKGENDLSRPGYCLQKIGSEGESVDMDKIYIKRYSEAFKKTIVREYEAGESIERLKQRYGVGGGSTIQRWVKKYGIAGMRHEVIVMKRADEQGREKQLEARVKELESALAQLTLDKMMLETTLEVASELYGEDIKKKNAPKSLSEPKSKAKKPASE
jgi:transposase